MAINENKRLAPIILKADQNAYISLSDFRDYQPANPACMPGSFRQVVAPFAVDFVIWSIARIVVI